MASCDCKDETFLVTYEQSKMGASDHNGSNDILVNKSALMTPTKAKCVDTTHTDKWTASRLVTMDDFFFYEITMDQFYSRST